MEETTTAVPAPPARGVRARTLGLVAAGLLAGGALGLTGIASAADSTPTPSPSSGTSTTTPSGHHCDKGSGGGGGTGTGPAPSTTAPEGGTPSSPSESPSNV